MLNTFIKIFPGIWPMIIIITVIAISIRLAYLFTRHKRISIFQEILSLIFILYILCLYHVVTFQDINYGVSNLVPFKEIFRYDIGSAKFYKNVIGNIVMFIPYGYFVSHYLKSKKMYLPALITLITSSTIEIVQRHSGRVFDIDDIILNLVGGILGYLIYFICKTLSSKLPSIFRNDTFINILVIIIIVLIILFAFNINVFFWMDIVGGVKCLML